MAINRKKQLHSFNQYGKRIVLIIHFEYQFLDDHFADVYRADSQVSTIVGALAMLAIIISCLGLFGLASYSAERRIKEVGIRKVLGASVQNIVLDAFKRFFKVCFNSRNYSLAAFMVRRL